MDIADKIKMLRKDMLGISQEKFANKIGVSRITVKNWEDGLSKPTTSRITMIALLCNVTTDYLIFDDCPLELSLNGIGEDEYKLLKHIIQIFRKHNEENCN